MWMGITAIDPEGEHNNEELSFDKEVNAAGNISCLGTSEGQSETETKTVTTACH